MDAVEVSVERFRSLLNDIRYDKLYLNTPIRSPAEPDVEVVSHKRMSEIAKVLNGISIDLLESEGFFSHIPDDIEAILSIIKRHPMNQYEITGFLISRGCKDYESLLTILDSDERVVRLDYKGYTTYRLR